MRRLIVTFLALLVSGCDLSSSSRRGTRPPQEHQIIMTIAVVPYSIEYLPAIQRILRRIGWAEQYVTSAEANAERFASSPDCAAYVALLNGAAVGFLYVQVYRWNQLAQIHGLAVDPAVQRQGAASALVAQAESFAREQNARGIYVDTPVNNERGRRFYEAVGYAFGYWMPRYYEAALDGVTYQKFFDAG